MTVCQAVAKRIAGLLAERGMTQYRLEQLSHIQHGTMNGIMSGRNKGIELNTVMMIAAGFGMTAIEFLDHPLISLRAYYFVSYSSSYLVYLLLKYITFF